MKTKRPRYQQGSISKIQRAGGGFVWKVRFSEQRNGERFQRTLTLDGAKYPTERDVRKSLEHTVVQVNAGTRHATAECLFGTITELYRKKHLPDLEVSTRQTNEYLLDNYIEPRFWKTDIREVKPLVVLEWLKELRLAPSTKSGIRSILSQCFELAALHEYITATERNPMSLVRIKGTGKRQKKIAQITIEQFQRLIESLPEPINVMTLVAGSLGLRISELVALQWQDIDWKNKEITIQRKFTHGALGKTKTVASDANLPLGDRLLAVLATWKQKTGDSEWLFPSPRTGGPRSASMLLQKNLKPVVEKLELGRVTWHTLRHACRSWLGGAGTSLTTQKDLLRHSDIDMTMEYGKTLPAEMRKAHNRMEKQLVPQSMLRK